MKERFLSERTTNHFFFWSFFWTGLLGVFFFLLFYYYSYPNQLHVTGIVRKEDQYYVKICFKIHSLTWIHSLEAKVKGEFRPFTLLSLDDFYTLDTKGNSYQCGNFSLPLKEEEQKEYYVLDLVLEQGTTTLFQTIWK